MAGSITSPDLTLDQWLATRLTVGRHGDILIGIVNRILTYPARGFMVEQAVPSRVSEAYKRLVTRGFTADLTAPLAKAKKIV